MEASDDRRMQTTVKHVSYIFCPRASSDTFQTVSANNICPCTSCTLSPLPSFLYSQPLTPTLNPVLPTLNPNPQPSGEVWRAQGSLESTGRDKRTGEAGRVFAVAPATSSSTSHMKTHLDSGVGIRILRFNTRRVRVAKPEDRRPES